MSQLSASPDGATPRDPDSTSFDPSRDDGEPPAIGSRVQLRRHVYGHVAGAQGFVVRGGVKGKGKVLVRFDDTGYQISVPREALASAEPR